MAIEVVNSAVYERSNMRTHTLTYPLGILPDDYMLMVVPFSGEATSTTVPPPPGMDLLVRQHTSSTYLVVEVYGGFGPPSGAMWTYEESIRYNTPGAVSMAVFRGVGAVNAVSVFYETVSDSTAEIPAITTTTPNTMQVVLVGTRTGGRNDAGPPTPAGWQLVGENAVSGTFTPVMGSGIFLREFSDSGTHAVEPYSTTYSTHKVVTRVALEPAATATSFRGWGLPTH